MRILVADDDRVISRIVCDVLELFGHEPVPVFDAIQLHAAAMRRPPPEAIILDLTMPGGTGVEALKKLKRSTRTLSIPVLVLTGTSDERTAALVKELGAVELIPKPFVPENLMASVASLIV
jgi:two-component system phosphate regulon response regulator PhoB